MKIGTYLLRQQQDDGERGATFHCSGSISSRAAQQQQRARGFGVQYLGSAALCPAAAAAVNAAAHQSQKYEKYLPYTYSSSSSSTLLMN